MLTYEISHPYSLSLLAVFQFSLCLTSTHHIDRQVQTSPGDSLSYRNHRVYHMEQTQHSDTGTGSRDRTSRWWYRMSGLDNKGVQSGMMRKKVNSLGQRRRTICREVGLVGTVSPPF